MADIVLVILGTSRLDPAMLITAASKRWPQHTTFMPASGRIAGDPAVGQLEIAFGGQFVYLQILGDQGLGVEGDDASVAEVLAWLTEVAPLAAGDSIAITDWAHDVVYLHGPTTADEFRALARHRSNDTSRDEGPSSSSTLP